MDFNYKEPKLDGSKPIHDLMKDFLDEGAPVRNTVINEDDIQNLLITLNTCTTLDNFLSHV